MVDTLIDRSDRMTALLGAAEAVLRAYAYDDEGMLAEAIYDLNIAVNNVVNSQPMNRKEKPNENPATAV